MFRIKAIPSLAFFAFMLVSGMAIGQSSGSEKSFELDAFFGFNGLRPNNPDQLYNQIFLKDSTYIYSIDEEDGSWNQDERLLFGYDIQGRILTETSFLKQDSKWGNNLLKEHLYGSNGNLETRLTRSWQEQEKTYIASEREHFYYNYLGLIEEEITEIIADEEWDLSGKTNYLYTTFGSISEKTQYNWNNELISWDPSLRVIFDYGQGENLLSETYQIWDDSSSNWVNDVSRNFSYDDQNRLIGSTRSSWNTQTQAWVSDMVQSLSYNEKGQLQSSQQFTVTNGGNEASVSVDAEYDDDGNLGTTLFRNWNPELGEWVPVRRHDHYWNRYITGNLNSTKDEITCFYSNPHVPGLPWFCESLLVGEEYVLTVYDQTGRLHHEQIIVGGSTFRLESALENGLYVVVVRGGLTVHSEKVLVKN